MACTGPKSGAVAAAAIWGMFSMMARNRPDSATASTLPALALCGQTRSKGDRVRRTIRANFQIDGYDRSDAVIGFNLT